MIEENITKWNWSENHETYVRDILFERLSIFTLYYLEDFVDMKSRLERNNLKLEKIRIYRYDSKIEMKRKREQIRN